MEERAAQQAAVLREEVAVARSYLAAEQNRHAAGEARIAATAEQDIQALRAQVRGRERESGRQREMLRHLREASIDLFRYTRTGRLAVILRET